jgi:hypothetical protein
MPRPDKAGKYLICDEPRGAGRCGGRIAIAITHEFYPVEWGILPGWLGSDDLIWHEPPRAFQRRMEGHEPNRPPKWLTGLHNVRQGYVLPIFDVLLRCPDCQTVHEIKNEERRAQTAT